MAGSSPPRVGVLALQGAYAAHIESFRRVKNEVRAVEVRNSGDLAECDALVIPGGESTVISKLITSAGMKSSLSEFVADRPVWGTCAGMILLSSAASDAEEVIRFGAIDIEVVRNAYGRQLDSFETELEISPVGMFNAVFIRAPAVSAVGEAVEVLGWDMSHPSLAASINSGYSDTGIPVALQSGNVLVTSFHPELTDNYALHEYFLTLI